MKHLIFTLGVFGALAGPSRSAFAAPPPPLAYEGFGYPAGSALAGANGGAGWAGAWTTNVTPPVTSATVDAGSLAFSDGLGRSLPTTGGSASLDYVSGATGQFLNRTLASSLAANGGTFYAAFEMRIANADAANGTVFNVFTAGDPLNPVFSIGRDYAYPTVVRAIKWGAGSASTSIVGSNAGAANLYVLRFDLGGGTVAGTSRIRVYLNPPLVETVPANADVNFDNVPAFSIGGFGLDLRGPGVDFDELRAGLSFASVVAVPEPAATGLLFSIAVIGAVGWQRRRNRDRSTVAATPGRRPHDPNPAGAHV